jgi:hypothetical protein
VEEISPECYLPDSAALKLLSSTVSVENLKGLLSMLARASEIEYQDQFHVVHYILYHYIRRDLVGESLQSFVLDIFNSRETSPELLARVHDMYHKLNM